jgi:hypothetical protein
MGQESTGGVAVATVGWPIVFQCGSSARPSYPLWCTGLGKQRAGLFVGGPSPGEARVLPAAWLWPRLREREHAGPAGCLRGRSAKSAAAWV